MKLSEFLNRVESGELDHCTISFGNDKPKYIVESSLVYDINKRQQVRTYRNDREYIVVNNEGV